MNYRSPIVALLIPFLVHGCYLQHGGAAPVDDRGTTREPGRTREPAPSRVPGIDRALAPPRPVAPLSTATVTSRRPTFRWELAAGTDGALLEVCADRGCRTVLARIDVSGTEARLDYDISAGVVFWRLTGRSGADTGASVSPTWQLIVGHRSAPIDSSWGTTLDVNGDGYADVVVGASGASALTGRAHVFLGSPTGLGQTPATTLEGPDGELGYFGAAVASAGDVNGDGYADVIVGANGDGGTRAGRAHLFLGGPSGLDAFPSTTLESPDGPGGRFGWSVASAGDVDADGYADVVVAAIAASGHTGRVYLYRGGAVGLDPNPTTVLEGPDGREGAFGRSLSGIGDMNGDGYADLAVGAPGAERVHLFFGDPSGLYPYRVAALTSSGRGARRFGASVANAGDVNGDGYADLVIGASGATYLDRTRVFLHLGSAEGMTTSAALTLFPEETDSNFGWSVAGAGDLNADGYADVVVAANSRWSSGSGGARVHFGGPEGLAPDPAATLTNPDGEEGFTHVVRGAGDVDGDDYADLIVGALGAPSFSGRAFLYSGGPRGLATSPAVSLVGLDGYAGYFGFAVAGTN